MSKRTPIVVCGDAGPVRQVLLQRNDVALYWANSVQDALATARFVQPQMILTRLTLGTEPAFELMRQVKAQNGPPVVALLTDDETRLEAACSVAGATASAPLSKSQSIFSLITEHTGLKFAKEVRVDCESPIEVHLQNQTLILETTNISVSGAAIRGFPPSRLGTSIELRFLIEPELRPITAKVVRCWHLNGERMAGVCFESLSPAQQVWLSGLVKGTLATAPGSAWRDLFGDLSVSEDLPDALRTGDISDLVSNRLDATTSEAWRLLLAFLLAQDDGQGTPLGTPPWLTSLAKTLTSVEARAARGGGPEWALDSVQHRIRVGEWRAANPRDPLPTTLSDDAYRLFLLLPNDVTNLDDQTVAEVSFIRAMLLAEICRPGQSRTAPNAAHTRPRLAVA